MRPDWYPNWDRETAVIVASGPSAASVDLKAGIGRVRFLAVNNSWRLCPWADALYAGDYAWWANARGCPEFTALRVTIDARACREFDGLRRVQCNKGDDRINMEPGHIGWGGNSGFGALNLAVQFGATKILLVGYDMNIHRGRHWHPDHPCGMHNPTTGTAGRWRRAIDAAAPALRGAGVTVINCSPVSSLHAFPVMQFAEALTA